jgi:predicted aldo/keto reductase-like oxidoreductase
MSRIDRREFMKHSVLGASGAILAPTILSAATRQDAKESEAKKPIRRTLGKTGIVLPIVSFGVMRADNPALIKAAYETGMVHFDTAHGYQKGKNEEMVGEMLKPYPRESVVVSTKVIPEGSDRKTGMPTVEATKEAFLNRLDISLKRLQMDYVDILYFHGIQSKEGLMWQPVVEALQQAKKAGKTRHIGVSTHKNEPEVITAAAESGVYEVVLTSVNFKQDHINDVKAAIAKAAAAGVGIVAMKTMAGGFYDKGKTKPINCKAALKWVLQDPNICTAIPGIVSFDHLTENWSVVHEIDLSPAEADGLKLGSLEQGLYCQQCEQCIPQCNMSLPVPDFMRAYMYAYGYGMASQAKELLTSIPAEADPCSGCESCSVECAKGFPVAERIRDVSRLVNVPEEFLS